MWRIENLLQRKRYRFQEEMNGFIFFCIQAIKLREFLKIEKGGKYSRQMRVGKLFPWI